MLYLFPCLKHFFWKKFGLLNRTLRHSKQNAPYRVKKKFTFVGLKLWFLTSFWHIYTEVIEMYMKCLVLAAQINIQYKGAAPSSGYVKAFSSLLQHVIGVFNHPGINQIVFWMRHIYFFYFFYFCNFQLINGCLFIAYVR